MSERKASERKAGKGKNGESKDSERYFDGKSEHHTTFIVQILHILTNPINAYSIAYIKFWSLY